jgi:two-component system, LytTR family, response regulator
MVKPEEIIRLEAFSNYTTFYLNNERKYLTTRVLKTYATDLEEAGFVRLHRKHLVNPEFILGVKKGGLIYLKDNTVIQMSRRQKSAKGGLVGYVG